MKKHLFWVLMLLLLSVVGWLSFYPGDSTTDVFTELREVKTALEHQQVSHTARGNDELTIVIDRSTDIGQLPHSYKIAVRVNLVGLEVDAELLGEIAALHKVLYALSFRECTFHQDGFSALSDMASLRELVCEKCSMITERPTAPFFSVDLLTINCCSKQLSDALLESTSSHLRKLWFTGCDLPTFQLESFPKLQHLYLDGVAVTPGREFGLGESIEVISLNNSTVELHELARLLGLPKLQSVMLINVQIDGAKEEVAQLEVRSDLLDWVYFEGRIEDEVWLKQTLGSKVRIPD